MLVITKAAAISATSRLRDTLTLHTHQCLISKDMIICVAKVVAKAISLHALVPRCQVVKPMRMLIMVLTNPQEANLGLAAISGSTIMLARTITRLGMASLWAPVVGWLARRQV